MKGPILIIEDNIEIRETLVDVLVDEGYKVMSAENGQAGLMTLMNAKELPCLVLLDLTMPIMDGFTFRQEQLKEPLWARIPTALLSADGKLEEKAREAQVLEYIKKPVDLDKLYSLAEKYCK